VRAKRIDKFAVEFEPFPLIAAPEVLPSKSTIRAESRRRQDLSLHPRGSDQWPLKESSTPVDYCICSLAARAPPPVRIGSIPDSQGAWPRGAFYLQQLADEVIE
jgi:hypothetical protein